MRETTEHCNQVNGTDAALQEGADSWSEALAGMMPFTMPLMVWGVKWASWRGYLPQSVSSTIGLAVSAMPLVGLSAGWIKGFPRWSYPYVGLIMALPRLTGFWLPLLVIGLIFLSPLPQLQAHSRRHFPTRVKLPPRSNPSITCASATGACAWWPLRRFGRGIRRDWTLLSFCFYGIAPMALVFAFEEAAGDYKTLYVAASSLILAVGALAYMRSATTWQRTLVLLNSTALAWLVATVSMATWWHGRQEHWLSSLGDWQRTAQWMVKDGATLLALMLAPALLTLLRRSDRFVQAT